MNVCRLFLILSIIFGPHSLYAQSKAKKKDRTIDELLVMEKVPPLKTSEFPKVKFRNERLASYMALQFGPKATDVLYLAYDRAESEKPYNVLFLYSPEIKKYQKGLQLKGRMDERRTSDEHIRFPKFKIETAFGTVKVEYRMIVQAFSEGSNRTRVWIKAIYKNEDSTCRIIMKTIKASRTAGESDTFRVIPLFGKKEFRMSNNKKGKSKSVRMLMKMGPKIEIHPLKRKSFLSIDVVDGARIAEHQDLLLSQDEYSIPANYLRLKTALKGKYKLRVKCDFGPLFTPVVYQGKKLFEL
ncbi:MAG: hypothetical protein HRT89_05470 [Lentisphaeria bacterium]|nr:hypothetical protein [Lentisphaeria bacterium]NQZ67500.1 hypothetical protein [Lentisphaeria bacterium]